MQQTATDYRRGGISLNCVTDLPSYNVYVQTMIVNGNPTFGLSQNYTQDIEVINRFNPELAQLFENYSGIPRLSSELAELRNLVTEYYQNNTPTTKGKILDIGSKMASIIQVLPQLKPVITSFLNTITQSGICNFNGLC